MFGNLDLSDISSALLPIIRNPLSILHETKNRDESTKIIRKYPDRIPVIVKKKAGSGNTPEIDKHKFLVPVDLTMGQLMFVIRKRIKLHPEKALFLFVEQSIVCNTELVSTVYNRSQDLDDGFLHVVYSCENTFG
jgi:GABA(A) receptor-associated protein